jgi:hypothetical protein
MRRVDIEEVVTARGSGTWYYRWELELATRVSTYRQALGPETRSLTRYDVRFRRDADSAWDARGFDSENARGEFLSRNFAELELNDSNQTRAVPHPMATAVGHQVTHIELVLDSYLQLRFDEHRLNLYAWPTVQVGAGKVTHRESIYADAVQSLRGSRLVEVDEYLDIGLVIGFDTGAHLVVDFRSDPGGPELADYQGPSGWYVWIAGEPPYDD